MKFFLVLFFFSLNSIAADFSQKFSTLFQQALEQDFEYSRLNKDVQIAQTDLQNKRLKFLPTATFSSSLGEGDSFTSNNLSVDLNLYNGLQDKKTLDISRLDLRVAQARVNQRRSQFESEFAKKLFEWIDLKLQVEVQAEEVQLQKNSLDFVKKRYEQGIVSEDEVLKLKVDLVSSEVRLLDLEGRFDNLTTDFSKIFGSSKKQLQDLQMPTPNEKLFRSGFPSFDGVEKNSPNVILREVELLQSKSAWNLAESKLYSVSLDGSFDYSNSATSARPYEYDSELGLSLTVPIFRGWDDKSEERKAFLRFKKSEISRNQASRDAKLRLKKAFRNEYTLRSSLEMQREAESLAKKFYAQSAERFRLGVTSANDIAFDLGRLTRAQTQLSQLKRDYFNNAFDIYFEMGKPLAQLFESSN